MRRQRTSWFQDWKITLRCTEFNRSDGSRRFVSTATLQQVSASSDQASLHRAEVLARSMVHTEEAFSSCEDAERDAIERAKREILDVAGPLHAKGGKTMGSVPEGVACPESDADLAARFEITFDGKRYAFRQYHYDQFQDALRYAVAEHGKDGFVRDESFHPNWRARYQPTKEDERTMERHGIAFVDGRFIYGAYRYDYLDDAASFAARHPNS